jgi:ATP-dependent RNA helicase DDX52/ROK1
METFQLLLRGGAKFDKKRFSEDVRLFNTTTTKNSNTSSTGTSKALHALKTGELPTELDFFKYAAGGSASGAAIKGKAKAGGNVVEDDDDDNEHSMAARGKKRGHEQPDTAGPNMMPLNSLHLR